MDDLTSREAWLALITSFLAGDQNGLDFDAEFVRRWNAGGREAAYAEPLERLLSDLFYALDESWMSNPKGVPVAFSSDPELRSWIRKQLSAYEAASAEVTPFDRSSSPDDG